MHELIADNFAGGGGGSTGIEWGLGRPVDIAINHCRYALGMHRINHPFTEHYETDVFDVDPGTVTAGRRVGLAHFSPDCTHHSKAKGGKPVSKRIRGLVLVMLRWAQIGTRVMTMENVEEIQQWGPLVQMIKNGKPGWYPDPQHKGRTWKAFVDCMTTGIAPDHPDLPDFLEVLAGTVTKAELVKGFGYAFDCREIRGYAHGAPTIRNRLFAVFRNDGKPIVWPAPTHADPKAAPNLQRWRTIAECLDWSLPCHSIFLSKAQARKVRCKRPLAKATLRRVAKGVDLYVLKSEEPFLVSLTHQGGDRVEPMSTPIHTITGAHRGEKALVCPTMAAPFVTEHANASTQRNFPADEPARTVCAQVKGGHFALVSGTLVQTGYGEREGQEPRALDPQAPLGTVVAGGGKHALAACNLVKMRGDNIGSGVEEPLHTISAGGSHHGLIAASVIRHFGQSIGQQADAPAPTVVAGGQGKTGVVAAYLAQHNGGFCDVPGHEAREPISTISSRGSQQQLVAASVAAYYGTESDGQAPTEPARTVTAKARMGLVQSSLAASLTPAQLAGARRVAKFLRAHGVEFEGEFATVAGCVIVDIGMRMLTPRELFRAQGFGDDYVIDRAWIVDPKTGETREKLLTKEQQIRMCGNSVCPPVMAALVRANVPELINPKPPPKWRPTLELMKQARLVA
jgi:DNA (cytosine-5)-methyltransferase 1